MNADLRNFSLTLARRDRAGAAGLTILVYGALAGLLLVFQTATPDATRIETRLTAMFLTLPKPVEPPKPKPRARPKFIKQKAPSPVIAPVAAPLPPAPAPAPVAPIVDLPKLAIADAGQASAGTHGTTGEGQGTSGAGGKDGGGGVTLFDGQWKESPSFDQLNRFLPRNPPQLGWAKVACRTIAHYRVTDCYVLEELPTGSGFGKTLRDASPTFLVIPPRLNGKEVVGAWVALGMRFQFAR